MKKVILFFGVLALLTMKTHAQTVTDYDGNVYNTVIIGTQMWLKENLKTTHYSDGTEINDGTNAGNIIGDSSVKYFFNYDNDTAYSSIFGKLYTWAAVMNGEASSNSNTDRVQGVCPTGWYVPTDAEWNIMEKYLDISTDTTTYDIWTGTDIGNKLKESDTIHWWIGNRGTNSSNFTAIAGGSRHPDGVFDDLYANGVWWTSTDYNGVNAWSRDLNYNLPTIMKFNAFKTSGFSVRCIKDSLVNSINDNIIDKNIQIYPNPSIDIVTLDYPQRRQIKMQIFNMIGGCVMQEILSSGANDINISSLSKGIYIIKLTGDNWTIQRKLMKE
jgi:uncharacterized protein (TIGR02145 family)